MLELLSTATSRGVLNCPFPVPYVPKLSVGEHVVGGFGQLLGVKMETRLYPVSATTSRFMCASQIRPLGYIAASEGPASVFRNVTVGDCLAAADPAAEAGAFSVAVATKRSAPTSGAEYTLRIYVPLKPSYG